MNKYDRITWPVCPGLHPPLWLCKNIEKNITKSFIVWKRVANICLTYPNCCAWILAAVLAQKYATSPAPMLISHTQIQSSPMAGISKGLMSPEHSSSKSRLNSFDTSVSRCRISWCRAAYPMVNKNTTMAFQTLAQKCSLDLHSMLRSLMSHKKLLKGSFPLSVV